MHAWIGQGASGKSTEGTKNVGEDKLQEKAPLFTYTFEVYN